MRKHDGRFIGDGRFTANGWIPMQPIKKSAQRASAFETVLFLIVIVLLVYVAPAIVGMLP